MTLKQRDYILKFLPYILTFDWHHNQVKFSLRDVISISNNSETAFHAPLALKWWCHNRRLLLKLKLSAYHSFWLKLIPSLRVWQQNKLFIFSGSFRTYCENSFEQKVKCPIWKKLLHKNNNRCLDSLATQALP